MKHNINGHFTAIDLFCGAGGVSQGLTMSKRVKILVAVNHSSAAIAAHKKNNPDIVHLTEDIKCPDLILPHLPKHINLLWASAECTNYSNAKGGQSRDADSRTLPEYLPTYVDHCNPDYFIVENVKEFLSWGPLEHKMKDGKLLYCKKGKPIYHPTKLYRGTLYQKWVDSICDMGYKYSYQLLNAADFGAHTNRTRYFGIFAKPDFPISFPSPTHSRNPGIFENQKWKACREMINLNTRAKKSIYKEKIKFFGKYFLEYDADLLCLLISDIKMRYLTSYELADCTGFKPGTYLGRTETERKYHIGNAVPPVIPEKMSEELYNAVTKNQ